MRGKSEEPRAGRRRGLGGVTAPRSELAHALLKGHDPDSDLECYQLLLKATNDHEHLNLGRLRLPNAVAPERSTVRMASRPSARPSATLSLYIGHIGVAATRAAVSGFPLFVGVLAPNWHRDADREFRAGWTWRWTQPHSGCTAFRVSEARRAAAPSLQDRTRRRPSSSTEWRQPHDHPVPTSRARASRACASRSRRAH